MNDFVEKQGPQSKPISGAISAESLNAMSPVELADALELALDSMSAENYNPDLIDAYLDVLEQKAPIPEEPDVESAFEEFKSRLQDLPFEDTCSASHTRSAPIRAVRRRSFKRAIVTVIAAVIALFALMIGAQAAGLDVFGRLARWTEELFYFSSEESTYSSEYYAAFQDALREQGLPKELAPTWYLEGFLPNEPQVWDDNLSQSVQSSFISLDGRNFAINIEKYKEEKSLIDSPYEKDSSNVEVYSNEHMTFYIMSNVDTVTAAWADGNLTETIIGKLSIPEVKKMIDSIGG